MQIKECRSCSKLFIYNDRAPTTESVRAKRLRDALADDIDSEKRAELRMLARLRRKDMERERRKAIRNAYRRVREAKKKKDPEVIMSLFIILII